MEYISNENNEILSWLAFEMWCLIISRCVWKKQLRGLKIIFKSSFLHTIFKLQCNAQYNKNCAWTYISCWHAMYLYFWKVWEMEFLIFIRDIRKPIISFWNLMVQNKNQDIISLGANNLCDYAISKFAASSEFKWIDS